MVFQLRLADLCMWAVSEAFGNSIESSRELWDWVRILVFPGSVANKHCVHYDQTPK